MSHKPHYYKFQKVINKKSDEKNPQRLYQVDQCDLEQHQLIDFLKRKTAQANRLTSANRQVCQHSPMNSIKYVDESEHFSPWEIKIAYCYPQ